MDRKRYIALKEVDEQGRQSLLHMPGHGKLGVAAGCGRSSRGEQERPEQRERPRYFEAEV